MPIRPENRARYPKDWKAISARIRFERAQGRCECEGECGIDHDGRCDAWHDDRHPVTDAIVVLTTAHLDHQPENCGDDNLKAMCQRCHNRYDGPKRREGIARRKRDALGMDELPLVRPKETRFGPRSRDCRDRIRLARWGSDSPLQRFHKKYVVTEAGCWEWQGALNSGGYGRFYIGQDAPFAHRFAYESLVGPVPAGMQIDHLCRNRGCVNPAHLEPVTPRENVIRGQSLAAQNAAKTHCCRGHPLTADNLYRTVGRSGRGECRVCKLTQVRGRKARLKSQRLTAAGRPYRYAAYLSK